MIVRVLIVVALGWIVFSALLAPVVGACIAGRRMTTREKEAIGWGGLALFMALFLLALLLIGTP